MTPLNTRADATIPIRRFRFAFLPHPNATNIPENGNTRAYQRLGTREVPAVVTGRAVVVIVSVEVRGLLLLDELKASGLVENAQAVPDGNPAEQDKDTLFGKFGIGVAVIWYVAEVPAGAGTVNVFGLAEMEKSVTVTGPA